MSHQFCAEHRGSGNRNLRSTNCAISPLSSYGAVSCWIRSREMICGMTTPSAVASQHFL